MSTRKKRPADFAQRAKMIVDIATGEIEDRDPTPAEQGKDPAADSLGRRGGLKGGKRQHDSQAAQLESAHLCHQRVRNFRPLINGNLQCPGCWIRNETERALTPISSQMKDDWFRCGVCGQTIEVV